MPAPFSSIALSHPSGDPASPDYNTGWDIYADASGNIAVNPPPLAVAQDVACSCRLFLGELWYDITQGIPLFQEILGHMPSAQFLKSQFIAAANSVPGVASAVCFLTGLGTARILGGQIQITDTNGQQSVTGTGGLQNNSIPWYVVSVTPPAGYP